MMNGVDNAVFLDTFSDRDWHKETEGTIKK
jgi:hypothetical protein